MTTAVALVVVAVAMAVARDGVSNESRTDDLPGHISWSAVRRRSVQFIAAPDVMSGCLVVLSAAGDQHGIKYFCTRIRGDTHPNVF